MHEASVLTTSTSITTTISADDDDDLSGLLPEPATGERTSADVDLGNRCKGALEEELGGQDGGMMSRVSEEKEPSGNQGQSQSQNQSQNESQNHSQHQVANEGCCAGCREPIRDKFIFSVIDLFWHQNCVQCCDCSLKLNERCYTYEGKLYCKLDYWRRFGPKCFACREPIERSELVQRIKGNRVYHLKCFTCNDCHKPLKAGEQLHLIDGKRLLCKQDYHHHQLQRGGGCKLAGGGEQHQQTYYTLLSSQQQQLQLQQQQHLRHQETGSKLVGHLEAQAGSGGEDEVYEELGGRRSSASNTAGAADVALDECLGDEELEESGEESLDNMRRLLTGYDNNNLENEENNHSVLRFSHNHNHHHHHNQNHHNYHHQHLNQNHLHTNLGEEDKEEEEKKAAAALKRKRRRKQKPQHQFGADGAKKLASRNGESILNGSAPVGSILAGSLQQPLSKNLSPAASTASNSSSSSSAGSLQQQQQPPQPSARVQTSQGQQHLGQQQQLSQQHSLAGSGGSSCGGGGGGGGSHKPTRVRTVLNEKQLQTLREVYAANPRPDALMKEQLVDRTGLSPRVIRVWFQNKRCKDKKKSILYKQMQQHEKDGRHLAGLTLMRGVPMVATSPIHYDDQSTVSSTPGHAPAPASDHSGQPDNGGAAAAAGSSPPVATTVRHYAQDQADIQAYQPPWKSLIEYANANGSGAHPRGATPPNPAGAERLDAASPHYQHLMGQIHGYGTGGEQLETGAAEGVLGVYHASAQPAQPPPPPPPPPPSQPNQPPQPPVQSAPEQTYHQMLHHHHHHHHQQQQQQQQQHHLQAPPMSHQHHLHQFQR